MRWDVAVARQKFGNGVHADVDRDVIVQQSGRTIARLKQQGFTILLVEQNFRFAQTVADRHYIVEHGRVVDMIAGSQLEASMSRVQEYLGV